jgi:hypothetical protein
MLFAFKVMLLSLLVFGYFLIVICISSRFNTKIFKMRFPCDTRYIKEVKPMNDVKTLTKGAVFPG